ncbi:MAG: hypothetical protein KJZ65_02760 [Phycisphaerales bacterium]|nr:hypothetical protein [Phycisphaerales bacterium]
MAKRPDLTNQQKKIVSRYYEHRDTISATKLSELVGELYLCAGDEKKSARLWKQAATALKNLGVKETEADRIVTTRDLKALALQAGKGA